MKTIDGEALKVFNSVGTMEDEVVWIRHSIHLVVQCVTRPFPVLLKLQLKLVHTFKQFCIFLSLSPYIDHSQSPKSAEENQNSAHLLGFLQSQNHALTELYQPAFISFSVGECSIQYIWNQQMGSLSQEIDVSPRT